MFGNKSSGCVRHQATTSAKQSLGLVHNNMQVKVPVLLTIYVKEEDRRSNKQGNPAFMSNK